MVDASLALPAGTDAVAVLTRAPSSGGKRRLFSELGERPDAALLRALFLDTFEAVRASALPAVVFATPASGVDEVRMLVPGVTVLPQREGDLGSRMRHAMETLFAHGAGRAAIVGSDVPTLRPMHLASAFSALSGACDLVLGPADDGGYYLLAAGGAPPVFEGIEWGTPRVLSDTAAAAARAGWRTRHIEALEDVDTVAALERAAAAGCPRTAQWILARQLSRQDYTEGPYVPDRLPDR